MSADGPQRKSQQNRLGFATERKLPRLRTCQAHSPLRKTGTLLPSA
ncbi:hypothetical protein SAMN05443248_7563 [Bradyrhizobium erythrophlei]|uniref:Uncharacterized protein n=1 Tax=Bradyrhizobium erythrophlei TaxID=1437360 RepID=A0A1M5XRJ0_9BRAD|nr:hypothetical protein SAMN05443248_7563 [Bradyrhizobium erythrophlei]